MRLKGKRAILTGGARGIGHGIVDRFLREGASAAVMDNKQEELNKSVSSWQNAGFKVHAFPCDLRDQVNLEQTTEQAIQWLGGVDILINNAGVAFREPFLDITNEHWDFIMDVNLNSMFRLSRQVIRHMVNQGTGGSIVNMSSKNGINSSSMLAHYNASKAGVILLTQSIAVEMAPHGIRVNAIAPGFIDTPLNHDLKKDNEPTFTISAYTPMKRYGTIEEVANAFLFLASDEASYITGTTLVVDGGHLANASEI